MCSYLLECICCFKFENGFDRSNQRSIISRRPQRAFRGPVMPAGSCAVSWSLGIVATAHGSCISVYSIARDEKLRTIVILTVVFAAAMIRCTDDLLYSPYHDLSLFPSFSFSLLFLFFFFFPFFFLFFPFFFFSSFF